jgi:cardiolipin synthase
MTTNLPNILTLFRIAVIPALVGAFFVGGTTGNWIAFALFAIAGITDYFDGFLARKLNQQTAFGRFLDPLADKLLVVTVLFLMVAFGHIGGIAVIAALVILFRELLISGLREFLAAISIAVPVSGLAKWKTTVQMFAIGFLLIGDAGPDTVPVVAIGNGLLWLAALLSLITGYGYLRVGLRHILDQDPRAGSGAGE